MTLYATSKFSVLLGAIILLVVVRLTTSGVTQSQLALDVVGAAVIVAAMLAACTEKRYRTAGLIIAIPAIVLTLVTDALPDHVGRAAFILSRALAAVSLSLAVGLIVRALLTERHVSGDTIAGAFCGYLLIGTIWTELYCLLVLISPPAFGGEAAAADLLSHPIARWHILQYFSFSTLTPLAYGDILPISSTARTLALMEAMCGQFYLAVLVAGLVGMHSSQRMNSRKADESRERPSS